MKVLAKNSISWFNFKSLLLQSNLTKPLQDLPEYLRCFSLFKSNILNMRFSSSYKACVNMCSSTFTSSFIPTFFVFCLYLVLFFRPFSSSSSSFVFICLPIFFSFLLVHHAVWKLNLIQTTKSARQNLLAGILKCTVKPGLSPPPPLPPTFLPFFSDISCFAPILCFGWYPLS